MSEDLLIELHTDMDTLGGYTDLQSVTTDHQLQTESILHDASIAVVSLAPSSDPLADPTTTQKDIETVVTELKKDPRVKRVQKNFRYFPESISTSDPYTGSLW
jgi:hypothetical protein